MGVDLPSEFVSTRSAAPPVVPAGNKFQGSCALIWLGLIPFNGTAILFTLTLTLESTVGSGVRSVCISWSARLLPVMAMNDPGATGPGTKLAPFCTWVTKGPVEEIVNGRPPEIPPPGPGVETVTNAVPALAMSLAPIDAVNKFGPTNVVGRAELFHNTVEEFTKFDPLTARVKLPPPAAALPGARDEITGNGLLGSTVTPVRVTVPFSTADTVTSWLLSVVPVTPVNVVLFVPAGRTTTAGTCSTELLLRIEIAVSLETEVASMTVQEVSLVAIMSLGIQLNEVIEGPVEGPEIIVTTP